jgi:hypothetical protein
MFMCTDSTDQKNVNLDQILAERRSYRMFTDEFPLRMRSGALFTPGSLRRLQRWPQGIQRIISDDSS